MELEITKASINRRIASNMLDMDDILKKFLRR